MYMRKSGTFSGRCSMVTIVTSSRARGLSRRRQDAGNRLQKKVGIADGHTGNRGRISFGFGLPRVLRPRQ